MIQYSDFTIQKLHKFVFYLLVLFLPTQLGYHFWPSWSLVLGRRIDYLSPTFHLTDIIIISILWTWLISGVSRILNTEFGIVTYMSKKVHQIKIFSIQYSAFSILILFVLVNIVKAASIPVAIYTWIKFLEFFLLGYYIVKTKVQLSTISRLLSAGILYSSLIAIGQFVLQHSIGGPLWLLGERAFTSATPGIALIGGSQLLLRPYATFPHPNVLGGFLATTLPLLINRLHKKQYLVIFVVGIIALILTFSRSAIAVGGFAILLTLARTANRKIFFLTSSLFILLFVLFIQVNFQEESVIVRNQLNSAAVKLWTTSPLYGVGLGNFLVRLPETLPTRTIYFLQPVHNIYLLLLSETGIVGLFLFLYLLVYSLKNFKFQISNFKLSLFALLLLGLVDHYPLSLQSGRLLLTILLSLSIMRT